MPLTRISLREGKSADYKRNVMTQVYKAMRETFDVPEEDRFMTVTEHDANSFDYGPNYLEINRTDDLLIIQITANNTRSTEQKKALFGAICQRLTSTIGVRPEDIFISIVEVSKENWSFGHGKAQYA